LDRDRFKKVVKAWLIFSTCRTDERDVRELSLGERMKME